MTKHGVNMAEGEKAKKNTKKGFRFYTYLNDDQETRIKQYIKDKFGVDDLDAGVARIMVLKLLSLEGY